MSTLGGSQYAVSRQKLNEIVKALRDCGTEEVMKLPKIAVIGNQSAGKSSLLESISRIKVPRASGTCTRCPMEVILNSADPDNWRCKVSLRIEHTHMMGQKMGVIEFGETKTEEEVPQLLRRAQLAILNPGKDAEEFHQLDEKECNEFCHEIQFSQNTVVLEITGANVDVTFIDLPGIISSTEKEEDKHLIKMIRDLAVSYVSQKECLILLTISMRDDIDNQAACLIAREFDPLGTRTIGALTKADTVQMGEHNNWFKILSNQSHKLQLGYYATRLPSSQEMDQTWEQARQAEASFFLSTEPWNSKSNASDRSRLGTSKLTEALSMRLSEMITETLPGLKKDLADIMRNVDTQLTSLPKSFADNPQAHLLRLCSAFIQEVDSYTNGKPNHNPDDRTFLQEGESHYKSLKSLIEGTRPRFVIGPTVVEYSETLVIEPLAIEEFTLEDVAQVIKKLSTRELYGITPFSVHEHFIGLFVREWQGICLSTFTEVEKILHDIVGTLCSKHFGRFRTSGLRFKAGEATSTILKKAAEQTRDELRRFCDMERLRPFTMNKEAYVKAREENITKFALTRHGNNPLPCINGNSFKIDDRFGSPREFNRTEGTLLSILAEFGLHLSSVNELVRIYVNQWQDEMEVIAHVVAYFDISSKRLIDDVPKIFESVFAKSFGMELKETLTDMLELVGDGALENCLRYIRDEDDVRVKRDDLTRQQEILVKAAETVDRFFKRQ